MRSLRIFYSLLFIISNALSQEITLKSSDKELELAFEWATETAMNDVGNGDPVGPWYEAALPNRESFCMRDVSHMSNGAYYLGLKGMLGKFAKNIASSRDWCSCWEMDKNNNPSFWGPCG